MFTYVKIVHNPISGPQAEYHRDIPNKPLQHEFVLKDFEHLFKNDPRRVISDQCVVCDAIEVFRFDRDEYIGVTATVGKTHRMFHFNNVIWTEVDESEA